MDQNTELKLHRGCIAYMNALGTKDLWKHLGSIGALAALKQLQDADHSGDPAAWAPEAVVEPASATQENRILFFSDMVAITSINTDDTLTDEDVYSSCLHEVVKRATALMRTAASLRFPLLDGGSPQDPGQRYPLAYRGCISLGKLIATDVTIVGPAVDVASVNCAKAECAVLWMDKKSSDLYKTTLRGLDEELDSMLMKYEVPVTVCKKRGKKDQVRSFTVNYLSPCKRTRPLKMAKRVLASFDRNKTDDGVRAKKRHTKDYFQKAVKAAVSGVQQDELPTVEVSSTVE